MAPRKRLGEMLIEAGIIDETQLKAALGHQRQWGVRIGQALVDLKLATEADIVRAIAAKFGFEIARVGAVDAGAIQQAAKLLPREFALRHNVLPIAADTGSITVAMSDPSNLAVVDEVQFRTGKRVKVCVGGDRELAEAVRRHYPGEGDVEAIALDLDAEEAGGEAVLDPFGGGSKDALDAFFSGPEGRPQPVGRARTPAAGPGAPGPAAPQAIAGPAARAGPLPYPAATTRAGMPAQAAPRAPPAASPRPTTAPWMPATAGAPGAVQQPSAGTATTSPPGAAPAAAQWAPAPAGRPAATAAHAPSTPARTPGVAPSASASVPRSPAEWDGSPLAIDLEDGPHIGANERAHAAPSAAAAGRGQKPLARAPVAPGAPSGEPVLSMGRPPEEVARVRASARELAPDEKAILDALERLAGGAHAEPDVLKPTQAMAAAIKLLLRKGLITESEFLDELAKK